MLIIFFDLIVTIVLTSTCIIPLYMWIFLIRKKAIFFNTSLKELVYLIFIYRDFTKKENGKVGIIYRLFVFSLIVWICLPFPSLLSDFKNMNIPEMTATGSFVFFVIPIMICVFYAVSQDKYY